RAELPADIAHILGIAINGRDDKQIERLRQAFRDADKVRHIVLGDNPLVTAAHAFAAADRVRIEHRIAELKAQEPHIPTTLVRKARPTPRETRIHIGGDFTRKGGKVEAGTLSSVRPEKAAGPTRLDLAKWLVSPDNPLTPRVTVNRIWQAYF